MPLVSLSVSVCLSVSHVLELTADTTKLVITTLQSALLTCEYIFIPLALNVKFKEYRKKPVLSFTCSEFATSHNLQQILNEVSTVDRPWCVLSLVKVNFFSNKHAPSTSRLHQFSRCWLEEICVVLHIHIHIPHIPWQAM